MAQLTVSYWEGEKKAHGKGAPATGLAAVLKKYETARATMLKKKTTENCDAASVALKGVSSTCVTATAKLADVKWKDLKSCITVLQGLIKGANAEIEEIKKDLGIDRLVQKAGSQEEEVYEVLWATFGKQRDNLDKTPSKKVYASALILVDKLIEQAHKVAAADPGAKAKFEKQVTVLNGIKNTYTLKSRSYDQTLVAGLRLRQEVLELMKSADLVLTRTVGQLGGVKTKALTAKQNNDEVELTKCKKVAELLLKGAQEKYDVAFENFKPGTVVRNNSDMRQAKVDDIDMGVFLPVTTQTFTVNKQNGIAIKSIQGAAGEIANL